jgi:hypothetical protein
MKIKIETRQIFKIEIEGETVEFVEESRWEGFVKVVNKDRQAIILSSQNAPLSRFMSQFFGMDEGAEFDVVACSPSLIEPLKKAMAT